MARSGQRGLSISTHFILAVTAYSQVPNDKLPHRQGTNIVAELRGTYPSLENPGPIIFF